MVYAGQAPGTGQVSVDSYLFKVCIISLNFGDRLFLFYSNVRVLQIVKSGKGEILARSLEVENLVCQISE